MAAAEHHAPVARWVTPQEFAEWKAVGEQELGFSHVESGPLVRSSFRAGHQAQSAGVWTRPLRRSDVPA
jgi:lipoyl synthase